MRRFRRAHDQRAVIRNAPARAAKRACVGWCDTARAQRSRH